MSRQAFGVLAKIREVDTCLQGLHFSLVIEPLRSRDFCRILACDLSCFARDFRLSDTGQVFSRPNLRHPCNRLEYSAMKPSAVIACLVSVTVSLTAAAASIGDGSSTSVACQACHGGDGISLSSEIPNLAGQKDRLADLSRPHARVPR